MPPKKPISTTVSSAPSKLVRGTQAAPSSQQASDLVTGAIGPIVDRIPDHPIFIPDPNENFFDINRRGDAVVRPRDMLVLRLEFINLTVSGGAKPRLKKSAAGSASLIVHFPPQTITEETFFETPPTATHNPDPPRPGTPPKPEPGGAEALTGPPVRARIAGESRLAFKVPDGFDIPYTLEDVLAACETLELSVPANARPPAAPRPPIVFTDIFASNLGKLSARQRASLTSFAARSLRIAAVQGNASAFELRQATGGPGLKALKPGRLGASDLVQIGPVIDAGTFPTLRGPRPALPGLNQTAIEMPWRLILSPHGAERWRHAALPIYSEQTGRTELWHSRLVSPSQTGPTIEPPNADAQRTVRAVWALTGEGSPKPMQSDYPAGNLPNPNNSPFRMPMDDFDRFQIVHLSSNFSKSNYAPLPVNANLMMLSALGGWLDSRGGWDPVGLSVEEWAHRATMGRDHYVRVVYKGFLFPFGHRVSLIKVSERKFHNGKGSDQAMPGNTAYLRQRLFIIVRERERTFVDPDLTNKDETIALHRQMPFSSVRILTAVTPSLDRPDQAPGSIVGNQTMFWPCVGGQPFKFQMSATDIDGRTVQFELPMIFIDFSLASPVKDGSAPVLKPNFDLAETNADKARGAWNDPSHSGWKTAPLKRQRVALAPSVKAGDTSVEAESITFDGFVEKQNLKLRAYSENLSKPIFYPMVQQAGVRIAALAQLTGSSASNTVKWNARYLSAGFTNNQGEVFVDVVSEPGMAQLNFSTQGDRSGGFVQPNLTPSALSRLTGPVTGNVSDFMDGKMTGSNAFPATLSDLPLPLLFGCIPLGDVIQAVTNLGDKPEQVPKFASEASTKVESFINGLVRLFEFVTHLADSPGSIADAALEVVRGTLDDLIEQAEAYQAALVANAKARVNDLKNAVLAVKSEIAPLLAVTSVDLALPLGGLAGALTNVNNAADQLLAAADAQVGGVSLPAGFRQSLKQIANRTKTLASDVATITTLITQGKELYLALEAIVGHPENLPQLLGDPATLGGLLTAVQAKITPLHDTIKASRLLDGAPKQAILSAIELVVEILNAAGDLLKLLEMLTGDELTIRFDWNPPIDNWALPGVDKAKNPMFRANDKRGFLVAVEAKVKKNGSSAPKINVVCSLKHFDLVLIAPASFIELNFEKIEFRVDSAAKMDVDVLLNDIKFVGPLSFVETLRDLIPLDGFSDPPYLDITPQGIDAGFSLTLPTIAIGLFNLSNLSLGAGFTVPFIGQPLSVRFNFCTREQPFNLTVSLFGGGGFFGITLDPHGIQILEASFEFGASISIDLGVASGGVHVMAGIYFRMEKDACSLTGYFRLGGYVSVLGLISCSLELYLELRYEFESGKCVGKAQLTIEIEIFMFSTSVTVTCERKFAGANGDPTFRDLMGVNAALPIAEELELIDTDTDYAWREYVEAFA
ncbi:hypothetical protein SAMN04515648_4346 [Phyllobacterium sp. CL33Tsu]|uniref:hypothetical protein n=1 Tax=Phyllobacterium sp. CL33Tsu TaxID=1798191 RepID=UPI0008F32139|nr:hypothetical protein [Phyllobacterium sp. CL33Tsu]SFJ50386.1 hypothetical protein SAMN04515648_4346 [Phyllobacterium sp. CL33Tsu]